MFTYTYDPKTFNADDYTTEELYQIMSDILTGVCKPEKKSKVSYAMLLTVQDFNNTEHPKLWRESKLEGRFHSNRR